MTRPFIAADAAASRLVLLRCLSLLADPSHSHVTRCLTHVYVCLLPITMSVTSSDPKQLSIVFKNIPRDEKKKWVDEFLSGLSGDDLTLIQNRAGILRKKRPAPVQSGTQSTESPGHEPEEHEGISCMNVPFIFPGKRNLLFASSDHSHIYYCIRPISESRICDCNRL